MIKIQTLLLTAALSLNASQAAIVLTAGTTYSQNFNSMGTSLTLPEDWQITFDDEYTTPGLDPYSNSSSSLAYEASSGTPTTPGTYNFGKPSSQDRAVGVIPDRTGSSPVSSLIVAHFQVTDPAITSLRIQYSLETYYIGNYPSSSVLGLYSSSLSATGRRGITGTLPKATKAGHFFDTIPSVSVAVDLTPADFAMGDLYLIYQFNGQGADGLALDNFSITAIPEPSSPAILILSGAMLAFRRKRPVMR